MNKNNSESISQCNPMLVFDPWIEYILSLRDITFITDEEALTVCKILSPLTFTTKKKWNFIRYTEDECGIYGIRVKSKSSTHYFEIDSDGTVDIIDEKTDKTPFAFTPSSVSYCHDWLRSNSFAMPYMGITIEEQIKREWIKLR
jgi:hypothetical protein